MAGAYISWMDMGSLVPVTRKSADGPSWGGCLKMSGSDKDFLWTINSTEFENGRPSKV